MKEPAIRPGRGIGGEGKRIELPIQIRHVGEQLILWIELVSKEQWRTTRSRSSPNATQPFRVYGFRSPASGRPRNDIKPRPPPPAAPCGRLPAWSRPRAPQRSALGIRAACGG